jgi:nicotinamidase-related amidase
VLDGIRQLALHNLAHSKTCIKNFERLLYQHKRMKSTDVWPPHAVPESWNWAFRDKGEACRFISFAGKRKGRLL